MEVRGLVAHAGEQLELEREQVRLLHVAEAAAVADHRVLLDRLELLAALEPAELVGAEVDGPVDDRPRREGPGDAQQRRRHPLDELGLAAACRAARGVHAAEGVGDHELGPQQAHAVDRQGGDLLGVVGDRQVDVEAGGERPRAHWPPARRCWATTVTARRGVLAIWSPS